MKDNNTLLAAWTYFDAIATPEPHLSPAERRRKKQLFYAGARGFLECLQGGLRPGDTVGQPEQAEVQALFDEICAFGRSREHKQT